MKITYDKKRKDITFCTMLFKMPAQGSFNTLKRMDRGFENFYLPSLKRLLGKLLSGEVINLLSPEIKFVK